MHLLLHLAKAIGRGSETRAGIAEGSVAAPAEIAEDDVAIGIAARQSGLEIVVGLGPFDQRVAQEHDAVAVEKLKRAVGVPLDDVKSITLGKPRVAYRQCLARTVDFEYKFQKQTGGRGKFAVISVKYTPLTPEQIEEKVREIEELADPKVKPDPNSVYFVNSITQFSAAGQAIRLPPALMQPMASDDVAAILADIVLGAPVNGMIELAGPERIRLDELVRRFLRATHDTREVTTDVNAKYFGVAVDDRSRTPGDAARIGQKRFDDWLARSTA